MAEARSPHQPLLASAAHDVRIWRFSRSRQALAQHATFAPPADVVDVAWPQNGQDILGVATKNSIYLHDAMGNLVETIAPGSDFLRTDELTALRFADRGNVLVMSGTHKIVHVWDRQTQAYTETYTGHTNAIVSLAVSSEHPARLIASGSSGGDVLIHTRSSNTITALDMPLSSIAATIPQLQFNYFLRSQLAVATGNGDVHVWDVNKSSEPILSFKQLHSSAITGLAHTSFNRHLLVTAGRDHRICVLDVTRGKKVTDFVLDHALTCLAYKNDGMTLAVGTTSGRLGFFDLRNTTRELNQVGAHEPHSIKSICFQEVPRSTSGKAESADVTVDHRVNMDSDPNLSRANASILPSSIGFTPKSISNLKSTRNSLGAVPISNSTQLTTPILKHTAKTALTHLDPRLDIFSPLQTGQQRQSTEPTNGSAKPMLNMDVFSPLQLLEKPSSSSPVHQPTKRVLFASTSSNSSLAVASAAEISTTTTSTTKPVSSVSSSVNRRLMSTGVNHKDSKVQPEIATTKRYSSDPMLSTNTRLYEASTSRLSIIAPTTPSSTIEHYSSVTTPSIQLTSSLPTARSPKRVTESYLSSLPTSSLDSILATPSGQPSSLTSTAVLSNGFSTQLLENLIDDAMQTFRESVRNDIQNVHLELLRQFEIQKTDLQQMFADYLKVGEVMEENEQLREENRRLRCKF